MCNIAGYVGTRDATPILIEMMKRQEGFWGGYYSGLSTIHGGKIHHAKIIGDTQRMLDYTDAKHLPGTVGVLHSRSKSGGDDLWSHPFIGAGGHVAYSAYGGYGFFASEPYKSRRTALFNALEDSGYHSRSRTLKRVGSYPTAPDGSSAHVSDIMAQYITSLIDDGLDAPSAMERAYCTMPGEIVGLTLHDAEPDCIVWSRVNQPMVVGFADHGVYLATTALAFPDDAKSITSLPAMSCGRVYRDRFTAKPFDAPPCSIAPITAKVWHDAYAAMVKVLGEKLCRMEDVCAVVEPCFESADCMPSETLAYEIMHSLWLDGRLGIEKSRVDGMLPTVDAPLFRSYLK